MSNLLRIHRLLCRYLRRYGEPPHEQAADAVDRVWKELAPHVASNPPTSAVTVASGFLGHRSSKSEGGRRKARWAPLAAAAVFAIAAIGTAIVWRVAEDAKALFRVAEGK